MPRNMWKLVPVICGLLAPSTLILMLTAQSTPLSPPPPHVAASMAPIHGRAAMAAASSEVQAAPSHWSTDVGTSPVLKVSSAAAVFALRVIRKASSVAAVPKLKPSSTVLGELAGVALLYAARA